MRSMFRTFGQFQRSRPIVGRCLAAHSTRTRVAPFPVSAVQERRNELPVQANTAASISSILKNKGILYASALPLVAANVVEPVQSWTHMFGHAPPPIAGFLGVLPLGMFFFLQMSPMQAMKEIKKTGSVGDMSPLPYVALGTNCVVWTTYGLLQADPTLIVANGVGAVMAAYYTSVYAKYTPSPMTPYYMGSAAFLGAAVGGYHVLPAMGIMGGIDFLGVMGNVVAIGFFASPLAVMKKVIADKSTAAMPFVVTVATTLNCIAWSGYGFLVAHDAYVILPNTIGFALACVQLSLFVRFGIGKPKVNPKV